MLDEHIDHVLVGLENVLTLEQRGTRQETAVATNRIVNRQAVTLADDVVLQAVPRGGMYSTGARIQGDMVAQHDRDMAVIERVLQ